MLFDCESVYILKVYSIHYTLRENSNAKKIPFVTKHVLVLLSPTHHSFTLKSQLLYKLKHKVHLFKIMCGTNHLPFRLIFMKVYIFVPQKAWAVLL